MDGLSLSVTRLVGFFVEQTIINSPIPKLLLTDALWNLTQYGSSFVVRSH